MRTLGRTGVQVSPLCLGAMMFGAWGNPDHDESIRIIHRPSTPASTSSTPPTSTRAGSPRRSSARPWPAGGADEVVLATKVHVPMGDDPNRPGNSRRWIMQEVREQPAPARHRLDRPLPDPPARPRHATSTRRSGALTDLVRAGQDPLLRQLHVPRPQIVEAQWVAERRGRERFVTEQPPYSILVRGIEADVLPVCQQYGMGVIPWSPLAGGWLSGGSAQGPGHAASHPGRRGCPQRYDLSLPGQPAQARRRRPRSAGWPTRPGSR